MAEADARWTDLNLLGNALHLHTNLVVRKSDSGDLLPDTLRLPAPQNIHEPGVISETTVDGNGVFLRPKNDYVFASLGAPQDQGSRQNISARNTKHLRSFWDSTPRWLHHGDAHSVREILLPPHSPLLQPGERGFNFRTVRTDHQRAVDDDYHPARRGNALGVQWEAMHKTILAVLLALAFAPAAALAAGLPDFVPLPQGYSVRADKSQEFPLDHEFFSYPPEQPGRPWHRISVEGRTWRTSVRAEPAQKKKREQVFEIFLPVLEKAGWKVLRREGIVIAHLEQPGHDAWLALGGSSSEDVTLVVVEKQPPGARPH